jgi:hypothetical protein
LREVGKIETGIGIEIETETETELLNLPRVVGGVYDQRGRADALNKLRRKETLHGMGATLSLLKC